MELTQNTLTMSDNKGNETLSNLQVLLRSMQDMSIHSGNDA